MRESMVWRVLVLVWFCAAVVPSPAGAQARVALLIGNAYDNHASRRVDPGNDLAAVAEALRAINYVVTVARDLDTAAMKVALRRFRMAASDADCAIVYFAGPGFLKGGKSYVLGTDARPTKAADLSTLHTLDDLMDGTSGARTLQLVIADIRQDDPLADGQAPQQLFPLGRPFLMSAILGQVAHESDGATSPFAAAVASRLAIPAMDIVTLAHGVRDDVLAKTGGRQEPRLYGVSTKSLRVYITGARPD